MSRVVCTRRLPVLAAILFAGACGDGTGPSDGPPAPLTALPRTLTALEREAIRASNDFGLALLREVASDRPGENVVLSPFSASVALGMAYAGAESATADSMRETLGWGARTRDEILSAYRDLPALLMGLDPGVQLGSANAMWVRDGFPVRPTYAGDVQAFFDAEVRNGDFGPSTVADMNAWASQKTNGRIPKVIDRFEDEVVMLLNALYFKGAWRGRFDPSRTQSVPFTTSTGAKPSVPMMFRMGEIAGTYVSGTAIAEVPYGNTAFVMTLVLPDAGTSPRQWLEGMASAAFDTVLQRLTPRQFELGLPKFRLAVDYQLTGPLARMGMGIAFDDRRADFSRIAAARLYISRVKQDVFIDVNEEGTEAAAVTQVAVAPASLPPSLRLDRPFLFFIRERLSGTIFFAGIIEHPQP